MSGRPSGCGHESATFRERAFRDAPLAIVIGGATAGAVWGSGWTETLAPWPWIVSLVFVGLPHGAVDFAVSRTAWQGVPLAVAWLCYVAAMAAVACCFVAASELTMSLFAAASGWHFGVAHLDTDPLCSRRGMRAIRALARGCCVLAESLSGTPFRSWSDFGTALTRVHVASLPLLLPSLVAIGAAWWAWAPEHTLRSLAITSIGGYLIVTPAHELLAEVLRVPAIRSALARLARHASVRHAGA